jgi:hypothetical protein
MLQLKVNVIAVIKNLSLLDSKGMQLDVAKLKSFIAAMNAISMI